MERMSNEQLERRIHSFIERKLDQFPELEDGPGEPRHESLSLLARVHEVTDYFPHMHKPRQAH